MLRTKKARLKGVLSFALYKFSFPRLAIVFLRLREYIGKNAGSL